MIVIKIKLSLVVVELTPCPSEESRGDVMLVDDFPAEEDITKLKLMA